MAVNNVRMYDPNQKPAKATGTTQALNNAQLSQTLRMSGYGDPYAGFTDIWGVDLSSPFLSGGVGGSDQGDFLSLLQKKAEAEQKQMQAQRPGTTTLKGGVRVLNNK